MSEEKSTGEKSPEPKGKAKPRFRLKFTNTLEVGRSDLSKPKFPLFYGPPLTSKFYSGFETASLKKDERSRLIFEEIKRVRCLGPREKYEEPHLESQRYGWYQERFITVNPEIERVHFPKRTSEMVKIQNLLANAAEAEKLFHQSKSKSKSK